MRSRSLERRVLVVGGASGIGASVVERYRAEAAQVTTWDRQGEPDQLCDITDPDQVDAALAHMLDRQGVPSEITITAGVGHSGLLTEIEPAEWDRVQAVNTKGPWLVMRAFARVFADLDTKASIVATSSVSARIADRSMGAYCASKAALSMLVQVAAAEWAPLGLRVNAVAPGVTDTPMLGGAPVDQGWLAQVADRTALGRLGSADDIAEAILGVHRVSWMTGQVVEVDGGLGLHSPINAWEP